MAERGPDYAIGSDRWPGLSKLSEEAGEVVQVLGKVVGTGGDPHHWDGTDLRRRLEEELGDLLAAAEFVLRHNPAVSRPAVLKRQAEKLELFEQWHAGRKGGDRDRKLRTSWLQRARQAGYERGFVAYPNKALTALERRGLVERDPTTSGEPTLWRVTEAGMRDAE